ncbi:MAG: thiamine pyrophosphate-binding protein [Planctomycetia bacterium]
MTGLSQQVRYSHLLGEWLTELGYSHCFFVAGGGCMHLIDGFRHQFQCIPVVHEVAAGIAAEHFNQCSTGGRAFALVTTGPGLTNILTAIAGCYVEHRELLVIAGQVKTADLKGPQTRQLGVQEIDGETLCKSISVRSERLVEPMSKHRFTQLCQLAWGPHPGPVVIEVCLDVQGAAVNREHLEGGAPTESGATAAIIHNKTQFFDRLQTSVSRSKRPVLLLGGLLSRHVAWAALDELERLNVPVLTTTSAIDRIPSDSTVNAGRVGTWGGQRSANLILAQADLVVVCGAQLDLQQTGFAVDQFAPNAEMFQVFPCEHELAKGAPKLAAGLNSHPDPVFSDLIHFLQPAASTEWIAYTQTIRTLVPILEPANTAGSGYVLSFEFLQNLSLAATPKDLLAVSSSGGSFTGALQMYHIHPNQYASTSAAAASMGYGLATAIGMSFANPGHRVILAEGDGGFCQNLQELALVRRFNLPIKIFILFNEGYASIRATQRKFFNGAYVGCDTATGLGFPEWIRLFQAFDIPCQYLEESQNSPEALKALLDQSEGPEAWIVRVDPDQTNWPAVASKMLPDGKMASRAIYDLLPPLSPEINSIVTQFLQ